MTENEQVVDDQEQTKVEDPDINNEASTEEVEKSEPTLAEVIENGMEDGLADGEEKKTEEAIEEEGGAVTEETGDVIEPDESELTEDEILAPLEDSNNEKTKKRFNKLTSNYKELKEYASNVNGQFEGLKKVITDVASPEEFQGALDFLHQIKSGTTEGFQQAKETLDELYKIISPALGEVPEGVDVFSEHSDLKESVENLELSQAHALEILKSRTLNESLAFNARENNINYQTQTADNQSQQRAVDDLNRLEQNWKAYDPNFDQKIKIVTSKLVQMKEGDVRQGLEPLPVSQWARAAELLYHDIKDEPTVIPGKRSVVPLTSGGGNNSTKNIETTEDAIMDFFKL